MGKKENSELKDWRPTSDPRIKRRYNGELYARLSKFGIRIEQRLHESNMASATKAADLIEGCLRDGKTIEEIKRLFKKSIKDQPKKAVLIGEHWHHFFEYRKAGDPVAKLKPWRIKTRLQYASFWERSFESFFANRLPVEIEKTWGEFIEVERKRSKRGEDLGFEHHIKYLNTFCAWMFEHGHIKSKPKLWDPNWVASEEDEDVDKIVYTDAQVAKMLSSTFGPFGLFVRCAALMGMRSSEITQFKKDRLNLRSRVLKLRASDVKTGSKTNKGRTIPIHPDVMPLLLAQIELTRESEFLFPNRIDAKRPMDPSGFRKQWDELGVEGSPHSLRHTYATKVFGNPRINPVLAAKALGMSMQTAERVYIHFSDDQLAMVAQNFGYKSDQNQVVPGTGLGLVEKKQ